MLIIKAAKFTTRPNGVNGDVKDIYIEGGKVINPPERIPDDATVIDARGMIVMPGGVDMHAHIAGSKGKYGPQALP